MSERLPAAVTQAERILLGDGYQPVPEYQAALLRSAYRQELLLSDILAELRARPTPIGLPVDPIPATPKPKR